MSEKLVFHEGVSEVYLATVPAQGRCSLCGTLFEFGPIEYTFEAGDADGDACSTCAGLAPAELRRRMLSYAALLRSRAEELEELAS